MDLLQRWTLLIMITVINVELFDPKDYQFWIIAVGLGIACSPLLKKKRK